MNLIQQQWKSQSDFFRVIEFTKDEISKLKLAFQFSGSTFNEVIAKDVIKNSTPKESFIAGQVSEFQKYLLSWPEMTDEEFNLIKEKRNHFNEWK